MQMTINLLALTADKAEKDVRFHEPKTDKEISELQSKQLSLKQTHPSVYLRCEIKGKFDNSLSYCI